MSTASQNVSGCFAVEKLGSCITRFTVTDDDGTMHVFWHNPFHPDNHETGLDATSVKIKDSEGKSRHYDFIDERTAKKEYANFCRARSKYRLPSPQLQCLPETLDCRRLTRLFIVFSLFLTPGPHTGSMDEDSVALPYCMVSCSDDGAEARDVCISFKKTETGFQAFSTPVFGDDIQLIGGILPGSPMHWDLDEVRAGGFLVRSSAPRICKLRCGGATYTFQCEEEKWNRFFEAALKIEKYSRKCNLVLLSGFCSQPDPLVRNEFRLPPDSAFISFVLLCAHHCYRLPGIHRSGPEYDNGRGSVCCFRRGKPRNPTTRCPSESDGALGPQQ